jgi:hypothetical protein
MVKGEEDEVKTSFPLEPMEIEVSFHKSLWHMASTWRKQGKGDRDFRGSAYT